ncbi:MAG TPA: SDR family NAD(P)-dependent oxidoreductase, partial [Candidatus Babeliaceae bacterium]|nr:SDR family NAD(P)-dependent oxidoreductase [Candidatus Babeliaceae bacterium]
MSKKANTIFWRVLCVSLLSLGSTEIKTNVRSPKKAIVIGASVGMGRELSKLLAADGYIVGMAARRLNLLKEIQQEIPTASYVMQLDAAQPEQAVAKLKELIEQIGGLDLLVLAITGYYDCDFDGDWTQSIPVLDVDVTGFFALARTALDLFERQGYGHLVGFSSIDGIRGVASCPAYSASKAFCSRYLEAERNRYAQRGLPITVTDIVPGWINSKSDLDFTQIPNSYWVESLDQATQEIFQAIKNKKSVAYITSRWQKVAELLP